MFRKSCVAAVAALALATSAFAAPTITVTPVYSISFDMTNPASPVPVSLDLNSAESRNPKYLHQFALDFTTSGMATNQGFDYASFNISVPAGMTIGDFPYDAGNQAVAFANNGDLGSNPADLQSIFVQAAKKESYEGLRGNTTAAMGEFYLRFAGNYSGAGTISANPITGFSWGYYDSMTKSTFPTVAYNGTVVDMNTGFNTGSLSFQAVPEPASLGLLGLGALGLVARRRRA